jgi:hypothetical protein
LALRLLALWKKLKEDHASSQDSSSLALSLVQSSESQEQPNPYRGHLSLATSRAMEQAAIKAHWDVQAHRVIDPPLDYRVDPFQPAKFMAMRAVEAMPALRRAPSPASSSSTRSSSAKKPLRNKEEEEKVQRDIDMIVGNFKKEYKDKITCEKERDMKNVGEDQEYYQVARWFLVSWTLQRLAVNR